MTREQEREIFQTVARHLLKQGAQSIRFGISENPTECVYNNRSGLKCAVGALIPDDKYRPVMDQSGPVDENPAVLNALAEVYGWGDTTPARTIRLLRKLQIVHDYTAPACWGTALKNVAEEWGNPEWWPEVAAEFPEAADA